MLSPDVETAALRPLEERGPSWVRLRLALVFAYAVGYVWWFFEYGIIVDRISVLLSVAFFLMVASIGQPPRRWLMMFGDLFLFVAMWIAYDESRGVADQLGFPIQVESVRNIDRFLFLGTDPVVWLQDTFDKGPDNVQWYDVVGSMVYYSHFIVPPVTIAVLWFLSRTHWVGYMRRFATVLFIGCAMFILLPTAPPWMAAGGQNRLGLELDALPPLSRPTGRGWRHIGLDAFVKAWDHGRDWANQVAAMPSLHSAFAIFVVVFCFQWVKDWRWRALMLLYPLSMAVALMYFAEHYFVDALAGWAIVLFSFWMWDRIEKKWAARKERLAAVGLLEEIEQTYTTAARPDPTDETPGDTAHSLTTAARPDPTDETPGDTAHSLTTAARPDPTDETPGDTAPDAVQSRPR